MDTLSDDMPLAGPSFNSNVSTYRRPNLSHMLVRQVSLNEDDVRKKALPTGTGPLAAALPHFAFAMTQIMHQSLLLFFLVTEAEAVAASASTNTDSSVTTTGVAALILLLVLPLVDALAFARIWPMFNRKGMGHAARGGGALAVVALTSLGVFVCLFGGGTSTAAGAGQHQNHLPRLFLGAVFMRLGAARGSAYATSVAKDAIRYSQRDECMAWRDTLGVLATPTLTGVLLAFKTAASVVNGRNGSSWLDLHQARMLVRASIFIVGVLVVVAMIAFSSVVSPAAPPPGTLSRQSSTGSLHDDGGSDGNTTDDRSDDDHDRDKSLGSALMDLPRALLSVWFVRLAFLSMWHTISLTWAWAVWRRAMVGMGMEERGQDGAKRVLVANITSVALQGTCVVLFARSIARRWFARAMLPGLLARLGVRALFSAGGIAAAVIGLAICGSLPDINRGSENSTMSIFTWDWARAIFLLSLFGAAAAPLLESTHMLVDDFCERASAPARDRHARLMQRCETISWLISCITLLMGHYLKMKEHSDDSSGSHGVAQDVDGMIFVCWLEALTVLVLAFVSYLCLGTAHTVVGHAHAD